MRRLPPARERQEGQERQMSQERQERQERPKRLENKRGDVRVPTFASTREAGDTAIDPSTVTITVGSVSPNRNKRVERGVSVCVYVCVRALLMVHWRVVGLASVAVPAWRRDPGGG
jgi:hypothetical protein